MQVCANCWPCLQVPVDVQADPVAVGEADAAQAHVGRGVVEVAHQVHGLRAPLGTQQLVELLGTKDLIGHCVRDGSAGRGGGRGEREKEN